MVFAQIGDGDIEVALNGISLFEHALAYHGVRVVFEVRSDVAVLLHEQKPDEGKNEQDGDHAHHEPLIVYQPAGERRRQRALFAFARPFQARFFPAFAFR